ncbi:MAG: hypothetical protein IPI65_13610 [Bacteroidetes bacterium]|nr:hypothetical protein [Bacteroidota bacterium]
MKSFIILSFFLLLQYSCKNPEDHKKEAVRYFKENKYDNALEEINKAIDAEPDSLSYYQIRFVIYNQLGRHQEVILDLNKIIELDNESNRNTIYAYHERALAKFQLGLYNEALIDINYFIANRDTVGSLIEAYLNKASILYNLNELKESRSLYQLVIKENIKKDKKIQSEALVGLANLAISPKESLKLLNEAILIDDKCAIAFGARGNLYYNLENIQKAHEDLSRINYIE